MRKWIPFNQQVMNSEFDALPRGDMISLFEAMKNYALEKETGWQMKNYGNGLFMITDSGRGQGRCLFFTQIGTGDETKLVALTAYKKETQAVPSRILARARDRKSIFEGKQ